MRARHPTGRPLSKQARARATVAVVAASACLTLTACGPHWLVVRQVVPNPMVATSPFFVQRLSLDGMRIGEKTEAEWMGPKEASTQESWEGDKVAMASQLEEGFERGGEGLVRAPSPVGAFTVITHYLRYEPGFYAVVVSRPGRIDAVVDIVDPNGTPLDQFVTSAGCSGFSQGQNARDCSKSIGFNIGKYLKMRVGK